ncbi:MULTISPECIES: response regulator transcription factor [Thauera]|uniref:response regulator transcription factor n=1 Tax=Thauera TaxID=33057 RepID=UPI0002CFEEAA|nr:MULTISPECIES: response regulator transcription factor [Thauera]ENO75643.1 DNA-binding response regulator [Thauera sp. 63]MDD3676452.1 response regulator transcription factor [Thauera propionica]
MNDKAQALIHVVEDDEGVARLIAGTLERFGFRHAVFSSGGDFLRQLRVQQPDLAILDLGLPDMDGMEVLQQLRSRYRFGLLIATGREDTHDRVMGLELGADDYVVKPFEPRELIARVRSILRRYQPEPPDEGGGQRVASFAGWRFECATHRLVSPDGVEDTLSLAESQLLIAFLERPNQILSREQLLSGRDVSALDRSIDLRVSRLRKRFEQGGHSGKFIKTVYGAGYLLATPVSWR